MTAVVGILNKQCAALAADSAVTITLPNGKQKILNKANKLFALSKCHPVGIVLYNAASFMGVPWETIIKMYRQNRRDKGWNTLQDWVDDFLLFLKENNWFLESEEHEKAFIELFIQSAFQILNKSLNEWSFKNPQKPLTPEILLNVFEEAISKLEKDVPVCPSFENFTPEMFLEKYENIIPPLIDAAYNDGGNSVLSTVAKERFSKLLAKLFIRSEFGSFYTGLVFSGFGEKEIFPQLIALNISMAAFGRLRYYEDAESRISITHANPSNIADFAQTDVIRTILSGVAPSLIEIQNNVFQSLTNNLLNNIVTIVGDKNPEIAHAIRSVDVAAIAAEYSRLNEVYRRQMFIDPLITSTNTLSKEDLGEMAESLIYLTYLKRRMTFEDEGVGGPVDVAIITKGEGFVWIKRKHYFAPELNRHYFDNHSKF